MLTISIIIPTLNEANTIETTINQAQTGQNIEIIVVDAGSDDTTRQLASQAGAKVLPSPKGRACQMNTGADQAQGEILLFLHADTQLTPGYDKIVRHAIQQPAVIGGAFELKINSNHPGLRIIERAVNFRSHWLQLPYGDQALWMSSSTFAQLGGFPEIPIMEDFALTKQLQKQGKLKIINQPVITSARRWEKKGILKTTLINQLMIIGYYFGISPARLAQWYHQL